MSKLKILINPNETLRTRSEDFGLEKIITPASRKFFADMAETMLAKDGIGLAAPQIGKNTRVVVINTKEGPVIMINPKITKKSFAKEWGEEGCLSVPNVFGQVKRHKKVTCQYYDKAAKKTLIEAEGLMARVIQHEIDHLDGVLFIDNAKELKEVKSHE